VTAGQHLDRGLGARQRHRQREGGAAARALRRGDVAAHRARDLTHRRQPEAGTAEPRGDADIGLRERPEQSLDLGEREPDAAVRHREGDADLAFRRTPHRRLQADTALIGELDRVVDQILQRGAQPDRVTFDKGRQFVGDADRGLQPLGHRAAGEGIAGMMGQHAQIEEVLAQADPRGVAARGVDEQRGKTGEMLGAGLDGVDPAAIARIEIGSREQIADREDAGERRAHLVREGREHRLDHAGAGSTGAPADSF